MKEEVDRLREHLDEKNEIEETLKQSMTEIQKRCVKHQKSEVEVKRQLVSYQDMIVNIALLLKLNFIPFFPERFRTSNSRSQRTINVGR